MAEALPKDTRTQPLYGVDYEWEFEFRLAKAYQGEHAVLFQVISPPYNGYDMAIRYVKGNIRAEVRAVKDEPRHIGKVIARADDKTHKYLIRFRRSLGNDGYMQVYLDGTQVFDHRNALTTQSDSNDNPMAKFGIYNGGQHGIDPQAEFIGIWDNLRVRMAVPVVAKSDERAK